MSPEITSKSAWLKGADIKDGDKIKFLDAGEIVPSKFTDKNGSPKTQFNITVEYKGETKRLTVNFQSQRLLVQVYGNVTETWIGKEATMFQIPTPQGKQAILCKPSEMI